MIGMGADPSLHQDCWAHKQIDRRLQAHENINLTLGPVHVSGQLLQRQEITRHNLAASQQFHGMCCRGCLVI